MAKRKKNLGGFSTKRLLGVTKAKQTISRTTGIPMTKAGRQRKLGAALTGGCLLPVLMIVALVTAVLALVF